MGHAHLLNGLLEVSGQKLSAVVRDVLRIITGKPLPEPLKNNLYIGLSHLFADLLLHDVTALTIEKTAQIVEDVAKFKVGDINMPEEATRALKSLSFSRGTHTFASDQSRTFEHLIYGTWITSQRLSLRHLTGQSQIAFQRKV